MFARLKRGRRTKADLVSESGLFDEDWYVAAYSDVAVSGIDPLDHFVRYGSPELRDPGPNFNAKWYYNTYGDVRASKLEPLFHYLSLGRAEQRRIQASAALGQRSSSAFRERREALLASGLFHANWYLQKYRDVATSGMDPAQHFLQHGSAELRDPGPEFEAKWYRKEYPDVLESRLEPLFHYIEIGRDKGYATKGPPAYTRWRTLFDVLDGGDRAAIRRHIEETSLPKLTLAFVFDRTSEQLLARTAVHLRDQLYPHWTAALFLTGSCSENARSQAGEIASGDPRIMVRNVASPAELFSALGNAEPVLFVQGGVLLRDHALYMFAQGAAASVPTCVIYADEDRLDADGTPSEPRFKPDHSPILFAQDAYREDCFLLHAPEMVGQYAAAAATLNENFVSSLFKTVLSKGVRGVHLPFVLSHVAIPRSPPPSSKAALRLNPAASSQQHDLPRVSIIIPTKDRLELLEPCLTSLEKLTDYPDDKLELLIVDNGSVEATTIAYLDRRHTADEIKWIRHSDAFNYSRLNNVAALHATGDLLVLLNNDIEIIDPHWLRRLVAFAMRPEIGAVGAKLLYPDRTVQHGGVVLGIQGVAAHAHVGLSESAEGFQNLNVLTREVSGVTGACLAMRRNLFFELGGLDCDLAVAFNDTALCLAARRKGYQNLWVSDAILIHHESKSRGYDMTPERKMAFMEEARVTRLKYRDEFKSDPFYSPNLSLEALYELAYPPRRVKPWDVHSARQRKPRVLILSLVHGLGHGVAVVVDLQASYLARNGFDVYVAGPKAVGREMPYAGCTRVVLTTPEDAAVFAARHNIDCVVVHTPPFFSVVRFLGAFPPVLFFDHGEPPSNLFADAALREEGIVDKRFCSAIATRHVAISESVRAEAGDPSIAIVPNGNSHLAIWNEAMAERRLRTRQSKGWENKTVVLNVCRFLQAERSYKGVDIYADVATKVRMLKPAADVVFTLCGRATEEDAAEVRSFGIEPFVNIPDEELIDLYCAADIYANFSKWEGYNLGIGQALAMGSPVIASDIPAHRAFRVFTSNNTDELVRQLLELSQKARTGRITRQPIVTEWEPSLRRVAEILREMTSSAGEETTVRGKERAAVGS